MNRRLWTLSLALGVLLLATPVALHAQRAGVSRWHGQWTSPTGFLYIVAARRTSGILGLDTYRILLAENGWALAGMTKNHGDWQGRFWATRVDRERP